MAISGLIPARFLTITAHGVLTIAILWSRDDNVKAGLPLQFTSKQYEDKDTQLIIGLAITLGCLALEYFGFFGGLTTFLPSLGLLSTSLHSAACIALAFFIWDIWDCDLYWPIFGCCAALPAIIELTTIVLILVFGKIF